MIRTAARCIAFALGFVLTFPIHPAGAQTRPAAPPESRYEREWREIDSPVAEGLPQPALRKVDALLARARRERNAPGQIRGLLQRTALQSFAEEGVDFGQTLGVLEQELPAAPFPVQPVLHSVLGELYYRYLSANAYGDRDTPYDEKDPETWPAERLLRKAIRHYEASLADGEKLRQVPLRDLAGVLQADSLVPVAALSLYDLLAGRALAFFTTEGLYHPSLRTAPLSDPAYLAPAAAFLRTPVPVTDSLSLNQRALALFREVIARHQPDVDPAYWVQKDVQRMQFAKRESGLPGERLDLLFSRMLQKQASDWAPHPASAPYKLALAEHLARLGETYQPFTAPAHRKDLAAALTLCNDILERFPGTPAGQNAAALRVQLLRKNLSLKGEAVNPPGVPFRQLVEFQNVPRVYFSLYRLSSAQLDALPTDGEPAEVLPYVASRKAFRQWRTDLPGTDDLQAHAAEVKVDGLPLGQYLVVASGDSVASPADTAALAYARFTVSNLAFVRRDGPGRNQSFLVTDRQSGKPLAGVHLDFYRERGGHPKRVLGERTDADGRLTFPEIPEEPQEPDPSDTTTVITNAYFALHLGGDTLRFPEPYVYWSDDQAPDSLRTLFFTDRALYRPGQTIGFKAILIRWERGKQAAVPNRPVKILLRGVDRQVVDSLQGTTNAMGAYSGSFRAPAGLLNGQMTLEDAFGNRRQIRVEAYKRPAFTARFQPSTEGYRVGDSVAVRGVARTYADAPVDGARVSYRINRFTHVPGWHPNRPDLRSFEPVVETGSGTTVTDATGAFRVAFLAAGDSTLGRALQPTYAYHIDVEVTDANGETQSISDTVSVGHTVLQMQVEMPALVDGTKPVPVWVLTGTPNGAPLPARGTLTFYRLQSPGRPLRARPWERPDVHVLTPAEYRRHFPHDAYDGEDEVTGWSRAEKALVLPFDSERGVTTVSGQFSKLPAGEYVLEALARDSAGEEVRREVYFTLFQPRRSRYAKGEDHWLLVRQAEGQPGDKAQFLLDPGGPSYVLEEVEKEGRIERARWLRTGQKPLAVEIPIHERHRGDFAVHFTFVRHGRAYTRTEIIRVPHADKQLQVELLSFRDPLQPGQAEAWQLKIKGPDGKGVAAELAATLYDASLDALRPHGWEQTIFPDDAPDLEWSTDTEGFGTGYMGGDYAVQRWKSFGFEVAPLGDVQLNWFGYDHFGGYNAGYQAYQARVRDLRLDRNTARVQGEITRDGRLLSGRVIDTADSTGLAWFVVSIADTRIFTRTDSAGRFSLQIPNRPVSLLVSWPDEPYVVAEAQVKAEAWLVIPLDLKALDPAPAEEMTASRTRAGSTAFSRLADTTSSASPVPGLRSSNDPLRGAMDFGRVATVRFVPPEAVADEEVSYLNADRKEVRSKEEDNARAITFEARPPRRDGPPVPTRRNFNETAFFLPHGQADENGEVTLHFTLPDALTRWKLLTFAHTGDLKTGHLEKEVVAQKDFMATANPPRFLREGDTLTFTAKVINLAGTALTGTAGLEWLDAATGAPLPGGIPGDSTTRSFAAGAGQSAALHWTFAVPEGLSGITYRLVARSGNRSDGEERTLPVLPDRVAVQESLPFAVAGKGTRTYTLDKLLASPTHAEAIRRGLPFRHGRLTLELTPNPAWTVVEALPYLMEFPHECAEQVFSRFYANALAAHLVGGRPEIRDVLARWRQEAEHNAPSSLSALEKNPELKALQLAETPWLAEAVDAKARRARLAGLLDEGRLAAEQTAALVKVAQLQTDGGAFPWFAGMREHPTLTAHLVSEAGHLLALGVQFPEEQQELLQRLLRRSLHYLDGQLHGDYLQSRAPQSPARAASLTTDRAGYLYARSFFPDIPLAPRHQPALVHWVAQAKAGWATQDLPAQGMLALALHRMGDQTTPARIIKSLKERAKRSPEEGMYWPANRAGTEWEQAPVETQALLLEAFSEITRDTAAVEAMKVWLLRQKRTQAWPSTKATARACYALLLRGANPLRESNRVSVKLGGENVALAAPELTEPETGTGYVKTTWTADQVRPAMGTVSVTSGGEGYVTGALHWQYLERSDRVTAAGSSLRVQKTLLRRSNVPGGTFAPIAPGTRVAVGDLVKVRLEVQADQPLSFVHVKDPRAAGLEPVQVLSGFVYGPGLGYYQTTHDAASHFFIDHLPGGRHVLEYELRVTHAGTFSGGPATVQCMYAPEYAAHSRGAALQVE